MGIARFIGPGTAELTEIVKQTAWNWKDWTILICSIIAASGSVIAALGVIQTFISKMKNRK